MGRCKFSLSLKVDLINVADALLNQYSRYIMDVSRLKFWYEQITFENTPVSFIEMINIDNSTLFALWRTYSSLDESIDQSGRTTLIPPRRLLFPHNRFFTDDNPPFDQHWIRRARFGTGFHPYLQKAAFPQMTTQFYEDWHDYQEMDNPFVFERLVIADRKVAENVVDDGLPAYSAAFDLDASEHWWEPIRKNLAQFLGQYEVDPKSKAITYLHTQSEPGAKLSQQDHDALIKALEALAHSNGYELNVVSTQTSETDWTQRMTAIIKSSVGIRYYCSFSIVLIVFTSLRSLSVCMETTSWTVYSCAQRISQHW